MIKRLTPYILIFCFLLAAGFVYAQTDKPLRVEFSSLGRNDDYSIMLTGKQGLIVLRNDGKSADNQLIWRYFGYSVELKRKWKATITMDKHFSLSKQFYKDGFAHILYIDSRNKETRIKQVKLNIETGKVISEIITLDSKINIKDFKVAGNKSFILGLDVKGLNNILSDVFSSSDKRENRIRFMRYNWQDNSLDMLSDSIDSGMRPKRLDFFEHGNTMDVYTALAVSEGQDEIWMYSFDVDGSLVKRHRFSPVAGKTVVELAVTSSGKDRYLAASMSSLRDRYDHYEDYTDAIYLSVFLEGAEAVSRLYKLSNLNSFYANADAEMFRFFPGKKKVAGSVGYQLNMHPEIKGGNKEMILLAEAYYPEYHTEWYYDAYGVAHTRYVFDGYRFTHAIAIAFNNKAEISWDESMEISGIRSFSREKRLDVISDGNTAGLTYNIDNELHYQIVENGRSDGGPQAVTLPLLYPEDELKSSEEGRIYYWYDNYLLASGYQRIENDKQGNRKIFYFYKIAFQ